MYVFINRSNIYFGIVRVYFRVIPLDPCFSCIRWTLCFKMAARIHIHSSTSALFLVYKPMFPISQSWFLPVPIWSVSAITPFPHHHYHIHPAHLWDTVFKLPSDSCSLPDYWNCLVNVQCSCQASLWSSCSDPVFAPRILALTWFVLCLLDFNPFSGSWLTS